MPKCLWRIHIRRAIGTIIADDAGADSSAHNQRVPYVGTVSNIATIAAIGSSLAMLVFTTGLPGPAYSTGYSNAAGVTGGLPHVSNFETLTDMSGSLTAASEAGYSFGSSQTLSCPGPVGCAAGDIPATGRPGIMEVAAKPTLLSGGTVGGTTGSCTLTSTTQTAASGSLTTVSATVSAGGSLMANSLGLQFAGVIIGDAAPYTRGALGAGNGVYKEAFSGCGFAPSNYPTLSISYGVALEQIDPGTGIYAETTLPCSSGGTPTTNDGGNKLVLTCTSGDLFYGTVSYGTDNTSVFQNYALGASDGTANPGTMNDQASRQQPRCVYIPAGNYLTKPINLGNMGYAGKYVEHGFGCWIGDEHYHSNPFIVPNAGGDVFAFLDSNMNNSLVSLGNTQLFANVSPTTNPSIVPGPNMAGGGVRNLSITGNRLSTKQQNAIVYYGTTEFVNIDNVVVNYLNGYGLYAGAPDSTGGGSLKESIVQNSRFEFTGSNSSTPGSNPPYPLNAATIEITASGTAAKATEGSNNISFSNNRIYQSLGTAFWIHNGVNVGNTTRSMRISGLKIEGSNIASTTEGGDLLEIGDTMANVATVSSAAVSDVLGRNIDLVNAVTGYAALHIAGTAASGMPKPIPHEAQFMDLEGAITDGGYARGVQADTCQRCYVKMANNTSGDYNLAIGIPGPGGTCTVASTVKFSLRYDGNGQEQPSGGLTTCIDPAVMASVKVPSVQTFAP